MTRKKVNINSLPPNSRTTGRKPITPKVKDEVKAVKPRGSFARDVQNIANYLFTSVVVPIIKDGMTQFVTNGMDMILYGDSRPHNSHVARRPGSRTRRTNYAGSGPRRRTYRSSRENIEQEELYYASIEDARLVLGEMQSLIAEYGVCTVGDMYTLSNMRATPTQHSYGWDDLSGARTMYSINGYTIECAPPIYLGN